MLRTKITALVAGVTLVLSTAARAESFFQIEAGVGGSAYQRMADGVWWQSGFQHNLTLTAPSFRTGLTGNLWQSADWGIDWHADWVWLGTVRTDAAIPTPKTNTTSGHWSGADFVDYNVNDPCSGPCTNMSTFHGSGHDMGVMLTLEPHYDIGAWRFGVEAGPFIHRATWSIDVNNWYDSGTSTFHALHVQRAPVWNIGWTVGASIARGPFSLRYNYFAKGMPIGSEVVPPGWPGVHMVSMVYRF